MTGRDGRHWHLLHLPLLLSRGRPIHGDTDEEDIEANECQTAGLEAAGQEPASGGAART